MTYAKTLAFLALALSGAIFGFFYAWVCSTMWGLDAADPRVAIPAVQAMNASVRNAVFFPAFFLTPALQLLAAYAARTVSRHAAGALLAAALIYLTGAFLPTFLVNVPMNEALAAKSVPLDEPSAHAIWASYSPRWQAWNTGRALASLAALLLVGSSLLALGSADTRARQTSAWP